MTTQFPLTDELNRDRCHNGTIVVTRYSASGTTHDLARLPPGAGGGLRLGYFGVVISEGGGVP
ncbi:MAG TPA: hypothetical protein VIS09_02430 [Streptomyces sp.]